MKDSWNQKGTFSTAATVCVKKENPKKNIWESIATIDYAIMNKAVWKNTTSSIVSGVNSLYHKSISPNWKLYLWLLPRGWARSCHFTGILDSRCFTEISWMHTFFWNNKFKKFLKWTGILVSYLIFVTGTTGGACVNKFCRCKIFQIEQKKKTEYFTLFWALCCNFSLSYLSDH